VKLDKLQCDFNPAYCGNTSCILKPINRTCGRVIAGCNLVQTLFKVYADVGVYSKSSSNVYHPGPFRFRNDMCALAIGNENVAIQQTFAKALERFRSILQPCPLKVSVDVHVYKFAYIIL
jgi:hypothetical protein